MAKTSDAKLKAIKKYDMKTYERINARFRKDEMKVFSNYCKKSNHSKSGFMVKATLEKIERETGKTFEELLKETEQSKSSD